MRSFWVEMVKSYKFFVRKSQHYMLGNWSKYESKNYWFNTLAYPEKAKQYRQYLIGYQKALIKFMWLCYIDFVCGLVVNLEHGIIYHRH